MILYFLLISANSYEVPNMFYVFQLQWPGTICLLNNCQNDNLGSYSGKTWAIHGLWPSATTKASGNQCSELEFCTNNKFNPKLLSQKTQNELDAAWVGFYNPTINFRGHEWNKHGSCWDENDDLVPQYPGLTPQEEYFQTALQLWRQYNIYQILIKANIKPDSSNQYNTDDIKKAIASAVQTDIQFLCTKDSNNKMYLVSVSFCFNEQYKTISCPCPVFGGIPCGKNRNEKVYYPEY
ncbi:hypothetical protein pb186bvf_011129 [Paramecium bursaria]